MVPGDPHNRPAAQRLISRATRRLCWLGGCQGQRHGAHVLSRYTEADAVEIKVQKKAGFHESPNRGGDSVGAFINPTTGRMACLPIKGHWVTSGVPPVELFRRDHRTTFCEGYSATIVVISTTLESFPSVACILRISFVTLMRG
jgi:hypothetical protein